MLKAILERNGVYSRLLLEEQNVFMKLFFLTSKKITHICDN